MINTKTINNAMQIKLGDTLPKYHTPETDKRRAPKRELLLNQREIKLALKNALRYSPENLHEQLAP